MPIHSSLLELRYQTNISWIEAVMKNFNAFLNDHAQAEKKASGMAMSMLSHYPDRPELVKVMIDLSIEELTHFREVVKLMQNRGLILGKDEKDAYIHQIRNHIRKGKDNYLLDRLLTGAIIEARGCERFGLIAEAQADADLKQFYQLICHSEKKHHLLFIDLASKYFTAAVVEQRLDELLGIEAGIVEALPLRPALH